MVCVREQIKNLGEAQYYDACANYLDPQIVVYHNREIKGLEFDFLLLIPNVGLGVVEIKGWNESTVLRVLPTGYIEIQVESDAIRLEHPRDQVRSYRYAVQNRIQARTGKHPLVFHMVCYTNLSDAFLREKRFDINCDLALTFSRDDLSSRERFNTKLAEAIRLFRESNVDLFDSALIRQVRAFFEPDYVETLPKPTTPILPTARPEEFYSVAAVLPSSLADWRDYLDRLVQLYAGGCRIYVVLATQQMQAYAAEKLQEVLQRKSLGRDRLQLALGAQTRVRPDNLLMLFNWTSYVNLKEVERPLEQEAWVVDGGCSPAQLELLGRMDQWGLFNKAQYDVEHADLGRNILVKAGAGTGKTSVMIDRVSFLVHQYQLAPAELPDRIVMITFTNDAADNMRSRLKRQFENEYLLTGQSDYLDMVSQVDHMQISTIHSYAKFIIAKLGTDAGFGKDLDVASGLYSRRKALEDTLEAYIREKCQKDSDYLASLGLPVYELRDKLLKFVSSLENKSINLANIDISRFGDCSDNPVLHDLFIHVISDTESRFAAQLAQNDRVYLGRLMPVLAQLVQSSPSRLAEGMDKAARYLFIDEFQDTDDIQIGVLLDIARITGYHLFIVGDIKQCIYRFRGAQEKAFDRLHIEKNSNCWNEFSLVHNYRTDNGLLQVFAARFAAWGRADRRYLPYAPDRDALDNPVKSDGSLPISSFFRKVIVDHEQARLDALFEEVGRYRNQIEEELRGGRSLADSQRTIAILVRENWQAQEIAMIGREKHHLLVETNTGGDLFQSVPALEMLILVQVLCHEQPSYLSRFVESSFFDCKLNRVGVYMAGHPQPIRALDRGAREKQTTYIASLIDSVFKSTAASSGGYQSLGEARRALRIQPVLQVLHRLYAQLQPWERYGQGSRRMREFYRMNIDTLFELFMSSVSGDIMTINTLNVYLSNCIFTQRAEECRFPQNEMGGTRVICTTVHKAKGLEYGYIILPYASFPIDKPKRTGMDIVVLDDGRIGYNFRYSEDQVLHNDLFDAAQEAEERRNEETRILYVAMTRAQRAFSWIAVPRPSRVSWQALLEMEGER